MRKSPGDRMASCFAMADRCLMLPLSNGCAVGVQRKKQGDSSAHRKSLISTITVALKHAWSWYKRSKILFWTRTTTIYCVVTWLIGIMYLIYSFLSCPFRQPTAASRMSASARSRRRLSRRRAKPWQSKRVGTQSVRWKMSWKCQS